MALWQLMHLGTWCAVWRTWCAQVHELPQSHCGGDNRESTLFLWLHINYAHLTSVRSEHLCVVDHLLPLIYIYICIYTVYCKIVDGKIYLITYVRICNWVNMPQCPLDLKHCPTIQEFRNQSLLRRLLNKIEATIHKSQEIVPS